MQRSFVRVYCKQPTTATTATNKVSLIQLQSCRTDFRSRPYCVCVGADAFYKYLTNFAIINWYPSSLSNDQRALVYSYSMWIILSNTSCFFAFEYSHVIVIWYFCLSLWFFWFAICYRPSVCLSVCRRSVSNARVPYSDVWNFRRYIWYLCHPLIPTENFTEIVTGNPSAGGVKHKRGGQI